LSCHSVAVVLTLVLTKQIRINVHKRNNTKNTVQTIQNTVQTTQNTVQTNTKHSKYKYTSSVLLEVHLTTDAHKYPKILDAASNVWATKVKQVSNWGPTNIRRQRAKI